MECISRNEIYEPYMDLLGQATKSWVDSPEPIYVHVYIHIDICIYIYIYIIYIYTYMHIYIYSTLQNQLRHLLHKLLPLTVLSECIESTVNCGEFGLSSTFLYSVTVIQTTKNGHPKMNLAQNP